MILLLFIIVSCQKPEKTAYIDMNKVAEEYNEMKKVKEEFEAKQNELNRKYDSLAMAFQQKYQAFLAKANKMRQKKAQEKYNELMAEQQNIQLLQQRDYQQLQADFDKATEEVSQKLKDFIEKYGQENGYTYIFSRSELAGIAYGKKEKDITEKFIEALNAGSEKKENSEAKNQK